MKVLNKSKEQFERAKQQKCPRCKGAGQVFKEPDNCTLCNGNGRVWMSTSGWTRAVFSRMENSKLW